MTHPRHILLTLPLLLFASACDQIAVLDGTKAREADAIAVGSACRHSGRALEDCYAMYPDAPKAQVFAGWKEMNDYMTTNKIEVVEPTLVKAEIKSDAKADEHGEKSDHGKDGKSTESGKAASRPAGLPPTSAAAADPLAGISKAPAAAAGDKAGDKSADKPGAKPAAKH